MQALWVTLRPPYYSNFTPTIYCMVRCSSLRLFFPVVNLSTICTYYIFSLYLHNTSHPWMNSWGWQIHTLTLSKVTLTFHPWYHLIWRSAVVEGRCVSSNAHDALQSRVVFSRSPFWSCLYGRCPPLLNHLVHRPVHWNQSPERYKPISWLPSISM